MTDSQRSAWRAWHLLFVRAAAGRWGCKPKLTICHMDRCTSPQTRSRSKYFLCTRSTSSSRAMEGNQSSDIRSIWMPRDETGPSNVCFTTWTIQTDWYFHALVLGPIRRPTQKMGPRPHLFVRGQWPQKTWLERVVTLFTEGWERDCEGHLRGAFWFGHKDRPPGLIRQWRIECALRNGTGG